MVWGAAGWRNITLKHCQMQEMLIRNRRVSARACRPATCVAGVSLWITVFGWKIGMQVCGMQQLLHKRQPKLHWSTASYRSSAEMRCSPSPCQTRRPQGCWTSPFCAATPRQLPTWPRAFQFGRCAGGEEHSCVTLITCRCFLKRFWQAPTSRTSLWQAPTSRTSTWMVWWKFQFFFGWPWASTLRCGSNWARSSNLSLGGQAATWSWGVGFLNPVSMADTTGDAGGFLCNKCLTVWGRAGA